jgi:hypothetical protein
LAISVAHDFIRVSAIVCGSLVILNVMR